MSVSSRHRPSLTSPSTASVQHTPSVRSTPARRPPPPVTTVVTTPPWARDEPPSPKDRASITDATHGPDLRPSDAASYSTSPEDSPSRWWTFTLPRTARQQPYFNNSSPTTAKPEKKGIKDISIPWLPAPSNARETATFPRKGKKKDAELGQPNHPEHDWTLPLPTPPSAPYTLSHNMTPGWDDPWSPRTAVQGPTRNHLYRENSYGLDALDESDESKNGANKWCRRQKRCRVFILSNTYVPLLFRLINITFTTSALAVAIRIRRIEMVAHTMGAVGSSPTVVIIFAPLTLVHVMIAIYLEYFGRPLGLWRTSGKLTYTLSEVLFICAWSAALSISFDNFFTSLIPCASASSISWYNELPRPPSTLQNTEHGVGDRICDYQLALICLVAIGLLAYCTNLVISLFRIFEKVKYRSAAPMR
ncbi:hypothetical protein C0995_015554 [Termitomyces sp. Mi166|nr:hypothetical protein C0995_015554 [Termitomyces sp. Mi166\